VDFRSGIYLLTAEWLGKRMTATDWEIGRRIVEVGPAGQKRTGYGEEVVGKLSEDLSRRFGRGFVLAQIAAMRQIYLPAV
jgi:hypothetical protein